MQHSERRVVFFDLDGTLHQQDMFGSFLRYLLRHLPLNLLLVGAMGRRSLPGWRCAAGGALADEPPAMGASTLAVARRY